MSTIAQREKVFKGYAIIFVAYLILVICYFCFRGYLHGYLALNYSQEFAVSFCASLAEDLFIFLLGFSIAVISSLVTLNDPKDGSFETRVKALANSERLNMDNQLYRYLQQTFTETLAFNKKMVITIEVREYNEKEDAYYIYTEIDTVITNMCKDNVYAPTNGKAYVEPDLEINGHYGMVVYIGSYLTNSGDGKGQRINAQIISGKFEYDKAIEIPPNEERGWLFKFMIWNKFDKLKADHKGWFFTSAERYTQNVDIVIKNRLPSQKGISFDLKHEKSEKTDQKDVTLTSNGHQKQATTLVTDVSLEYDRAEPWTFSKKLALYPSDRILFFVNKQMEVSK